MDKGGTYEIAKNSFWVGIFEKRVFAILLPKQLNGDNVAYGVKRRVTANRCFSYSYLLRCYEIHFFNFSVLHCNRDPRWKLMGGRPFCLHARAERKHDSHVFFRISVFRISSWNTPLGPCPGRNHTGPRQYLRTLHVFSGIFFARPLRRREFCGVGVASGN